MSYKNLEIWLLAREVAIEIHKMSLEQLPKFKQFETIKSMINVNYWVKNSIIL